MVVDQKKTWDNGFGKCQFTLNPTTMLSFELRVSSISFMLSGRIGEEMSMKHADRGGTGGQEEGEKEKEKGNGEEKKTNAKM